LSERRRRESSIVAAAAVDDDDVTNRHRHRSRPLAAHFVIKSVSSQMVTCTNSRIANRSSNALNTALFKIVSKPTKQLRYESDQFETQT
jgi:hypothetical protein